MVIGLLRDTLFCTAPCSHMHIHYMDLAEKLVCKWCTQTVIGWNRDQGSTQLQYFRSTGESVLGQDTELKWVSMVLAVPCMNVCVNEKTLWSTLGNREDAEGDGKPSISPIRPIISSHFLPHPESSGSEGMSLVPWSQSPPPAHLAGPQDIPRVFPGYSQGIPRVFQGVPGCSQGVPRAFPGPSYDVPWAFLAPCYKPVGGQAQVSFSLFFLK